MNKVLPLSKKMCAVYFGPGWDGWKNCYCEPDVKIHKTENAPLYVRLDKYVTVFGDSEGIQIWYFQRIGNAIEKVIIWHRHWVVTKEQMNAMLENFPPGCISDPAASGFELLVQ